jgi:hypothetical protein
MTIKAIGGIPCRLVIGRRCSQIGIQVAIHTLIPNPVKAQSSFRSVTILAFCQPVVPKQGKPIALVQFYDVVDQPIVCIMATFTICTHRLLVEINMAGNAV